VPVPRLGDRGGPATRNGRRQGRPPLAMPAKATDVPAMAPARPAGTSSAAVPLLARPDSRAHAGGSTIEERGRGCERHRRPAAARRPASSSAGRHPSRSAATRADHADGARRPTRMSDRSNAAPRRRGACADGTCACRVAMLVAGRPAPRLLAGIAAGARGDRCRGRRFAGFRRRPEATVRRHASTTATTSSGARPPHGRASPSRCSTGRPRRAWRAACPRSWWATASRRVSSRMRRARPPPRRASAIRKATRSRPTRSPERCGVGARSVVPVTSANDAAASAAGRRPQVVVTIGVQHPQ
jgi:hypothetical protein